MAFEDVYVTFLKRLPGVAEPLGRLTLKDKLKWTGLILIIYFVMSQISVYGVGQAAFEQFQMLAMLLGSKFGSLMTLGIGPIVTASIILQLLVGSKIIPWDLNSENGRIMFQGTQKLLAVIFAFLEAVIFVTMGAIPAASAGLAWIVVLQLAAGGILVIFMDELVSKWGIGSGVGLFIAAGVSFTIITRAFSPFTTAGALPSAAEGPSGLIPYALFALSGGNPFEAFLAILPIIATVLVFVLVVYSNALKVEIPLAFGNVSGFGRRWPLKFFYTSNIPVILIAALLANVRLMARMMADKGMPILGTFDSQGTPTSGLIWLLSLPRGSASQSIAGAAIFIGVFALIGIAVAYLTKKNSIRLGALFSVLGLVLWIVLISSMGLTGLMAVSPMDIVRMFSYLIFLMAGAIVFSIFWVTTAGMDAKSVAGQIESTGMQIPGYRRDVRIIERVLNRYIPGLTILGAAAVGFLAAFADFTNALGTGTGILLSTMIIYQLYEQLSAQHMEDMHPAIRRLLGK